MADAACGGAASADIYWMRRALSLAQNALYLSNPNPRVGCVIVGADGKLLAQGYTQQAGGRHAEAEAFYQAAQQGVDVRGATLYVTLEPCSHFGRTPPCADAIIAHGITRVVAALEDPNPQVAGQGMARLRAAGIAVDVGVLADEARELNIGFFSRMQQGKPWVRLKVATSLDGFTALPDGRSQWITGEAARADGYRWRARACAILAGVGTVLADDPQLTARGIAGLQRHPHLLIVDSQLRTPATAKCIAAYAHFSCLRIVFYTQNNPEKAEKLQQAGLQTVQLPANAQGQVDLAAMFTWLKAHLPVNELHVEAGATLNGALLQAGLVDEMLWYQAPKLLGQGRPTAALPLLTTVDEAQCWRFESSEKLGADLRMLLRKTQSI